MTTLPTVTAAMFALVAFVLLANLVLVHYARGVARTAVDEAVRTAAVAADPVAACLWKAEDVLQDLLGGSFGSGLQVECSPIDGAINASIHGVLRPLIPGFPSFGLSVGSSAVIPIR